MEPEMKPLSIWFKNFKKIIWNCDQTHGNFMNKIFEVENQSDQSINCYTRLKKRKIKKYQLKVKSGNETV